MINHSNLIMNCIIKNVTKGTLVYFKNKII